MSHKMACRPALLAALVLLLCVVHESVANSLKGNRHQEGGKGGQDQREMMRKLSASNHNFTAALYREFSQQEGNLFFSPFSIHTVLSMAYLGARGDTEKEFKTAMFLPNSPEVTKAYKAIFKNLKNTGDPHVIVKSANKIYTNSQFKLNASFKTLTSECFNSNAVSADFSSNGPAIREEINTWVEKKTNNKIKDLIAEGSLTSDTLMVLVNAIYFKGRWATIFEKSETTQKPFHVNKDAKVPVSMMHVNGEFNYKEFDDLEAKVLELNYAGDKLAMLIILPNKIDGLAELERKLTAEGSVNLQNILSIARYGRPEVNVLLPKFKMEQSTNLNEMLKKIGMPSMFENNADFSGMLSKDSPQLKVSKVAHKAFIEVNEEGAEAAAATMFHAQTLSISYDEEPFVFNVNHPFIFVIRHKPSSQALFVGRVVLPEV